jgi:hypothetical protein
MRILSAMTALGVVLIVASESTPDKAPGFFLSSAAVPVDVVHEPGLPSAEDNDVIQRYCVRCHSDARLTGNLSLEAFDAADPEANAVIAERMVRKLRAGMMPPPGARRPTGDTLLQLVQGLEARLDASAAANPNPGIRTFQRLNRIDYERSILALLALEVNAGAFLPLDTKSANFDNIADVQLLSPTLLDAYMNAATEISRLAVGDADALPRTATYTNAGYVTQWDRADGAPFGTRGGISVTHTFPADAEYVFNLAFEHTTTGGFFGSTIPDEQIEISIDGERVQLIDVDRWMDVSDPNGVNMRSDSIFVRAGPHRVTAAFLQQSEGPKEDLVSPHAWSITDRQVGAGGYGITALAHLKDMAVVGPYNATGVSDTPSRDRIFSCRPTSSGEARPCAEEIMTRLARQAFRRPVTGADVDGLMSFYDQGAADADFERGVRTGLEAMLSSPDFVFRFEEPAGAVTPGESYRLSDGAVASRLSFFLWGTPPDEELLGLAERDALGNEETFRKQILRMLADPRAEALGTRFAAQWLRLDDLEKVHPDRLLFPDFHQQLADAMRRETELFFSSLVQEDRSALELYSADYTYLNERLAFHYGIDGVIGDEFRRVEYPDETRRGLLGHGSILTLTSHAGRTSPVLRGKWVMEVLLGTPPPPPPPGVADLDETEGSEDGRFLTTRERMEIHRTSPTCNSCHRFMDPIGLALDNFDVTGRWRIRENGMPLDTQGELYDGTAITSPMELQQALVARPIPLIRTFTENLMAYALGRRVEHFDQPTVRAIAARAAENDYRMSEFIMGVVTSDAFRMQRAPDVTVDGITSGAAARHP